MSLIIIKKQEKFFLCVLFSVSVYNCELYIAHSHKPYVYVQGQYQCIPRIIERRIISGWVGVLTFDVKSTAEVLPSLETHLISQQFQEQGEPLTAMLCIQHIHTY